MKYLFLMLLVSNLSFAQTVRDCTNEVLTCQLGSQEASATFEGVNEDEPSIPPDSCSLYLSLETKTGLIFVVTLDDSDYLASIYNLQRPNLGTILGADVAFPVVKSKKFYFRRDNQILTCELN